MGASYRVPTKPEGLEMMAVLDGKYCNVIIMGTSRNPDIDWGEGTAHITRAHHFLNVLQNSFLCQLLDILTSNNAQLDLLITNNIDMITDVEMRDNLENSDHRIIHAT